MKEDEGKVMLTMPPVILVKFCKMLGIAIDNDEEIQIQLLTTSNIKAIYNTKPMLLVMFLCNATALYLTGVVGHYLCWEKNLVFL